MIYKSKFVKNIFLVASGTAFAQVITILFAPLLTRIYSPEDFGIFGSFNASIAFLLPLSALNYPASIVLAKNEFEKRVLINLSLILGFTSSLIILFLIFFNKSKIITIFEIEELSELLMLIPFVMFFFVLNSIMAQVAIRENKFNVYAKVSSYDSLIQNISKYFSGLLWANARNLVIISSFGYLIRAILLYSGLKKTTASTLKTEKLKINSVNLISTAYKYKDFALYRTPQVMLNAFSQSFPVLMLASYFGVSVAGFFSLSKMVLTAPVSLIGQSVSTVFYPRFNQANDLGQNRLKLLLKANLSLLAIGIIPLVSFMVIAPSLFAMIFGEEWRVSGDIASWLSIWVLVSLVAQPSVAAIPVLKIQSQYLAFEIVALILRFLSLYLPYQFDFDMIETIMLFSIANILLDLCLVIGVLLYAAKAQIKN